MFFFKAIDHGIEKGRIAGSLVTLKSVCYRNNIFYEFSKFKQDFKSHPMAVLNFSLFLFYLTEIFSSFDFLFYSPSIIKVSFRNFEILVYRIPKCHIACICDGVCVCVCIYTYSFEKEKMSKKHVYPNMLVACMFSHDFATPWTLAHQVPLFLGFSWQEYGSELPFLTPEIFPTQRSNPSFLHFLHWQVVSLLLACTGLLMINFGAWIRRKEELVLWWRAMLLFCFKKYVLLDILYSKKCVFLLIWKMPAYYFYFLWW